MHIIRQHFKNHKHARKAHSIILIIEIKSLMNYYGKDDCNVMAVSSLNRDLARIVAWFKRWGMLLNPI